MNRIDYINKINTYAARFVVEVQGFNAISNYHINIHAESFLVPVLNEVLGLQLENLKQNSCSVPERRLTFGLRLRFGPSALRQAQGKQAQGKRSARVRSGTASAICSIYN